MQKNIIDLAMNSTNLSNTLPTLVTHSAATCGLRNYTAPQLIRLTENTIEGGTSDVVQETSNGILTNASAGS